MLALITHFKKNIFFVSIDIWNRVLIDDYEIHDWDRDILNLSYITCKCSILTVSCDTYVTTK